MNKKKVDTILQRLLGIAVFAVLWWLAIATQLKYDFVAHPEINDYNIKISKHVMPAHIVRNLSFGFRNIIADYYWITAIQDLSGWDRTSDFYYEEYRNIATLDPRFAYPYLFGLLVVSSKAYPEATLKMEPISNIGIKALPFNWEIPFYLATEFNLLKMYDKAAHYIIIAASRPVIPEGVRVVYNRYKKNKIINEGDTSSLVKTIYDSTDNESTKKIIRNSIVISEITKTLQNITNDYKTKYGKFPTSVNEIEQTGMVSIESSLYTKYTFMINQKTGEVMITPIGR